MSDTVYCSARCRARCERNLNQMLRKSLMINRDDLSWFDFSLECPNYDPVIISRQEFRPEMEEAFTHD